MGIEVASCLRLNRKNVSAYVRLFTEGDLDRLLERNFTSHKPTYLSKVEQEKLFEMLSHQTTWELGFAQESYWNTKIIQDLLFNLKLGSSHWICLILLFYIRNKKVSAG